MWLVSTSEIKAGKEQFDHEMKHSFDSKIKIKSSTYSFSGWWSAAEGCQAPGGRPQEVHGLCNRGSCPCVLWLLPQARPDASREDPSVHWHLQAAWHEGGLSTLFIKDIFLSYRWSGNGTRRCQDFQTTSSSGFTFIESCHSTPISLVPGFPNRTC